MKILVHGTQKYSPTLVSVAWVVVWEVMSNFKYTYDYPMAFRARLGGRYPRSMKR